MRDIYITQTSDACISSNVPTKTDLPDKWAIASSATEILTVFVLLFKFLNISDFFPGGIFLFVSLSSKVAIKERERCQRKKLGEAPVRK